MRRSSVAAFRMTHSAASSIRKGHVHDSGMSLGGGEIHEPPLADQVDATAVRHRELVDEGAFSRVSTARSRSAPISISTLK